MMLPKTAIIGATGRIGRVFLEEHRKVYSDCVGTRKNSSGEGLHYFDLLYPDIAPLKLVESGHRNAIIAAGIARLAVSNNDKDLSKKMVEGTIRLAAQLAKAGIKPVYISSDTVFDGRKGHYADEEPLHPVNQYGREKAEIETGLKEVCQGNYMVARLSKVFTLVKGDKTIFDEMAAILMSGGMVRAAYDQILSCTLLSDAVNAVNLLLAKDFKGVVNVSSPEVWSRYDLAVEVADRLGVDRARVERISLEDLKESFERPKNSSFKVEKLIRETSYSFMPITWCIEKIAENWK